jgi:murein DD-endopeptidase MepM/ murein hydrolase activator NlpD
MSFWRDFLRPLCLCGGLTVFGIQFVLIAAISPATTLTIRHIARSVQPGEVVRLVVSGAAAAESLSAEAFGTRFPLYPGAAAGQWEGLIGIDLDVKPGPYPVKISGQTVSGEPVEAEHLLEVQARKFPTRRITVDEKYVNPPREVLDRIARESELIRGVFSQTTPERLWQGSFRLPVPGQSISNFGRRSVFNDQPRGVHAGVDLRGATGTPIRAPNRGRIVLMANLYFSGNTVIIDHGMGLFSYFAHLSRFGAKEGDLVTRGRVVGRVGATGRVSGPHLHWSVRLLGARVDPLSLVAAVQPKPSG